MRILDTTLINVKKLKKQRNKALFLIAPITILFALSIVISSQAENIKAAAEKSIFGTLKDQYKYLQVFMDSSSNTNDPRQMMESQDQSYTEADVSVISSIENVESATLNSAAPIDSLETSDLFENVTLSLTDIIGINEDSAILYTDKDFTYSGTGAIPIILNANTFIENYEDWGGLDTITIDMSSFKPGNPEENSGDTGSGSMSAIESASPIKRKAISYDESSLIGKEFTVTVGALEDLETYTVTRSSSGMVYTKKTADELATEEQARIDAISPYWTYDTLNTPLTYKFVVVGIIEDDSNRDTYVPQEFVNTLMYDLITKQLNAKIADPDTEYLNTTFTGLTYDGMELSLNTYSMGGYQKIEIDMPSNMHGPQPDLSNVPGGYQNSDVESYAIPGLVIQISDDGEDTVEGLYTDATVYESSTKTGDSISIEINDVSNRTQVIEDLNDKGYAYQDINDLEVIDNLEATLKNISIGLVIAFIVLAIAVIILTMSKFVSDSVKEIGIFRAIGMTGGAIKSLFISQAILYTLIGYIGGLALGAALNLALSKPVYTWFNHFVDTTVKQNFTVVNQVDSSMFVNFAWTSILMYSAILLVITIIVSFIPATTASRISPVEAIKGE